jgi:hypothetical protein
MGRPSAGSALPVEKEQNGVGQVHACATPYVQRDTAVVCGVVVPYVPGARGAWRL